jgi:hypothetical protein
MNIHSVVLCTRHDSCNRTGGTDVLNRLSFPVSLLTRLRRVQKPMPHLLTSTHRRSPHLLNVTYHPEALLYQAVSNQDLLKLRQREGHKRSPSTNRTFFSGSTARRYLVVGVALL